MILTISRILKKIFPKKYYDQIKKIYNYNYRTRNYDLSKDLKFNEDILISFKFDIDKIKSRLNTLNYSYTDEKLSWHYHLFAGLKDHFKDKKINILEIGTFTGEFTNFISNIYKNSEIYTIDLEDNDNFFLNSYGRDSEKKLNEFKKIRLKNLSNKNIHFQRFNSIHIKKYFSEKKFDLIWVDGDHLNPQVTIDIINSIDLLNDEGILCTDDVIRDTKYKKNLNISMESYFVLNHLEINNILKNYYLIKRINKNNFDIKKYLSLSIKKNNNIFI